MGSCYEVLNVTVNWTEAGLRCRSVHKDAHLLVVNNATEQSAVAEIVAATDGQ